MKKERDFQKNWEQIKKQLVRFSEDAMNLAQKGEEEIVRLSREGKLRLDSTNLSMQQEKLFYLIGKEYVKAKYPAKPTAKIRQLSEKFKTVSQKQRQLKRKMAKPAVKSR